MEKKDVRVQLVISQSEIDALDEWRAAKKIWSRSEAIRQLIADGLKPKDSSPAPMARADGAVAKPQTKSFRPHPKTGKK